MTSDQDSLRIRVLNDQIRSAGPVSTKETRWMITPGVEALGAAAVSAAVEAVRRFSAFNADNDPHGEHDFGILELAGERFYWKIDYYNQILEGGSPDPTNQAVTCRVLTIMLASEY